MKSCKRLIDQFQFTEKAGTDQDWSGCLAMVKSLTTTSTSLATDYTMICFTFQNNLGVVRAIGWLAGHKKILNRGILSDSAQAIPCPQDII